MFRSRPLEGRSPYLWLDAKVEKVRDGGRVRKWVVIARGAANHQDRGLDRFLHPTPWEGSLRHELG